MSRNIIDFNAVQPQKEKTSCYAAYSTFERNIIRLGKCSQCDWYEYLIFRSLQALDQDLGNLHSISVSARDFLCDLENITPLFWASLIVHKQNADDDISPLCYIQISCKFMLQLHQSLIRHFTSGLSQAQWNMKVNTKTCFKVHCFKQQQQKSSLLKLLHCFRKEMPVLQ